MKFTFLTKHQRQQLEIAKYSAWHKKFAWLPVRLKGAESQMVWFETVLRKGTWQRAHSTAKIKWSWTYVESTFDVLKMDR